jgi:hypothetical protein
VWAEITPVAGIVSIFSQYSLALQGKEAMRIQVWVVAAVLAAAAFQSGTALSARQAPRGVETDALARGFRTPPDDSRIMMRWWWFGPSMTREQAESEMRRMKEGGIGGFEIATVYPMAVDDLTRGIRNYPYLSREYLDLIGFTARKARELGLRMDVTLGSGWSFGGPHITPDLAAAGRRLDRREITPDVTRLARPVPYEHEQLIAAFIGRGSVREVDANTFTPLDLSGTGPISLPAGAGPRTVLFYFAGRTGQVVKRAALGAEGYVLDHYDRRSIEAHLREVGDKLIAAAGPGGIHAIFCDSLEVYDADWTPDMLTEFRRRRGYDLLPLLPMLDYDTGERSRAVRRDVGQTLTELYEERFVVPIRDWARKNNVYFRIQGYGTPPAALASFRHADLFDGEGFEWRMLSRARWASSAAHLFKRPVTGSETWTWIHSPAFRAVPLDIKGEADQHFLSGINQLIGHGWPASPPQAGTPGWPFYAAGALTDKNPWWPVMPDLAAYLQRVSFLLRQGEPVADVAIYAPTGDARASMRPGTGAYLNLWSAVNSALPAWLVPAILDSGYSFDAIDDGTLAEAQTRRYKAIVLPGVRWMPESTRQWLNTYAKSGGTIIAAERLPEGNWASLQAVGAAQFAGALRNAVAPDVTLTPAVPEIGFVHRDLGDTHVYFLANTSNQPHRVAARFRSATAHAELWDPMSGTIERVETRSGEVSLEVEPYASRIVVFRSRDGKAPLRTTRAVIAAEELKSPWAVRMTRNEADKPISDVALQDVALPYLWSDSPDTRNYSGTVSYRFRWQSSPRFVAPGARVFLDFGPALAINREALADGTMRGNSFAALVAAPIREAATVFVNGQRGGTIWAPPYRLDITQFVRSGSNEIRLDVYNTAINAMAEGGRVPDVSAVAEKYGQRFRLQDLEVLNSLPSGINVVPRIVAEK